MRLWPFKAFGLPALWTQVFVLANVLTVFYVQPMLWIFRMAVRRRWVEMNALGADVFVQMFYEGTYLIIAVGPNSE